MAGHSDANQLGSFIATAAVEFTRDHDGKLHVVPVIAGVTDDAIIPIRPASDARQHLGATANANALAHLPDGPTVKAGTLVRCTWTSSNHPLGGH